jgi:hypothetical protein
MAMGEDWLLRIPSDIWDDIVANKNDNYAPFVDPNKPLLAQGLAEDTITFIAMLHRDYWCDTAEERASLVAIFEENGEKWSAQLAGAGNTRAMLKMLHKK